jgi:hypothetical protein
MSLPMSARDPAAIKGFLPGIAAVVGILEPLLNRLENQVAMADASLTALLNVARTSQDLRISAGGRAATVSLAISTRRPLTAAEISSMDRAQGRVDLDRERIEAGVDQIGSPPRLAKAMNDAIEAYFGKAAPWLEKEWPSDAPMANTPSTPINSPARSCLRCRPSSPCAMPRWRKRTTRGRRARHGSDHAGGGRPCRRGAARRACGRHRDAAPAHDRPAGDLDRLSSATSPPAGMTSQSRPAERADEIGAMAGSLQVFKDAPDRQEGRPTRPLRSKRMPRSSAASASTGSPAISRR